MTPYLWTPSSQQRAAQRRDQVVVSGLDGALCALVTMGGLRGSKLQGIPEAQESSLPFPTAR